MGGRGKTKTENGALEGGGTLRIADIPSARGSVTDVTDVTVGFWTRRFSPMQVHKVGVDGDVCHIES